MNSTGAWRLWTRGNLCLVRHDLMRLLGQAQASVCVFVHPAKPSCAGPSSWAFPAPWKLHLWAAPAAVEHCGFLPVNNWGPFIFPNGKIRHR